MLLEFTLRKRTGNITVLVQIIQDTGGPAIVNGIGKSPDNSLLSPWQDDCEVNEMPFLLRMPNHKHVQVPYP
jgi:hypothetical protein